MRLRQRETGWAGEIISPIVPLSTEGINIPSGADIRLYSSPMITGSIFNDESDVYILSSDSERKKVMTSDSAGNAVTYTDSEALKGVGFRGGVMYRDQIQVVMDYNPDGGANQEGGLFSVNRDSTFQTWGLSKNHGGANSIIAGVKNSLFLTVDLPESLIMPEGWSSRALRTNYTFGPLGNMFFGADGALHVFNSSPNRKRLARIAADGTSISMAESDVLLGTNLRAGALYDNGYVVSVDYTGTGDLGGIYVMNSDGSYTEWGLSLGHGGISDLIPDNDGGYYFTDFENDNIWHITEPGQAETAVLKTSPVALWSIALSDTGELCAVNWIPGEWWSNGGVNALYRIVGDSANLAVEAPEGSRLMNVAAGKGGIFGNSFYVTDSLGGRVFRLESDNSLTTVISGLTNPRYIKFDPVSKSMAVMCDDQYILWFGENLTPFSEPVEPSDSSRGGILFRL